MPAIVTSEGILVDSAAGPTQIKWAHSGQQSKQADEKATKAKPSNKPLDPMVQDDWVKISLSQLRNPSEVATHSCNIASVIKEVEDDFLRKPFLMKFSDSRTEQVGSRAIKMLLAGERNHPGDFADKLKSLSRPERRELLVAKQHEFFDCAHRLLDLVRSDPNRFWKLPKQNIYDQFQLVAFGTLDPIAIRNEYPKSFRNAVRHAAVDFVDGIKALERFRGRENRYAARYLRLLIGKKPVRPPRGELTPFGLVIYADERDYAHLEDKSSSHFASEGKLYKYHSWLPANLQSRLAIVNDGGPVTMFRSADSLDVIKNHELSHAIFYSLVFGRGNGLSALQPCDRGTVLREGGLNYASMRADTYTEQIAYFVQNFPVHVDQLIFGRDVNAQASFQKFLNRKKEELLKREDLSEEEREQAYKVHYEAYQAHLEHTKHISDFLLDCAKGTAPFVQSKKERDRLEAALYACRPEKIDRLRAYFGLQASSSPLKVCTSSEMSESNQKKGFVLKPGVSGFIELPEELNHLVHARGFLFDPESIAGLGILLGDFDLKTRQMFVPIMNRSLDRWRGHITAEQAHAIQVGIGTAWKVHDEKKLITPGLTDMALKALAMTKEPKKYLLDDELMEGQA